ncbi:MAG: hypothetical protein QME68_08955, partial [Elusimicrobiota bacterium]|nr:hypothetical protein [Elusimicrobiota bacterium]
MKPELLIQPKVNTLPKLLGRIKLSNFLDLPEDRFKQYIETIENDPLFKELMYPEDTKRKVIYYRKFPKTRMNRNLCELKEEITAEKSNPALQELIASNTKLMKKIRNIGVEKFEKYFLYNETDFGLEQISKICNLELDDTKQIIDFVNSILIANEFSYQSAQSLPKNLYAEQVYTKVAKIAQTENSKCCIEYFSGSYARGTYIINYRRLYDLKKNGEFTKEKLKQIDKLIKKLELINTRKTLLYQLIMKIAEKQSKYFTTGNLADLQLLTQRMLSKELG